MDQWKETLAVLCSHSNLDEFQGLCDALARRLSGGGLAHAATLCWICAAKVDQALHVWAKELLSKQASVSELQVGWVLYQHPCLEIAVSYLPLACAEHQHQCCDVVFEACYDATCMPVLLWLINVDELSDAFALS